jgi:tagatose-1,6-bisphosphate aldolase
MIDEWQFPEDWWQNTYFEAGIQQTKQYVEQIHALTRAQGIPLVILAIPYVDDVKEAYDPNHPYAQAYHATVAIAQEVGIPSLTHALS